MPGIRYLKLVNALISLALIIFGENFLFGTLSPTSSAVAATEIFFSEYIEGSSNNKALEIFNGTDVTIDLIAENYDVQFFFNGNATADATISLTGTITPGGTYVVADDGADPAILAQTNQVYSGSFFNGDDAIALRKNGTIIDVIGQIGIDPGTQWVNGPIGTQDSTLRRKVTIETGDTDGNDPFDPASEWDSFAADTFDGLGSHTIVAPPPTDTPTPTPTVTVASGWIINEIHADPDSTQGDANGDGTVSTSQDEFIEIVNNTGSVADISNWTLSDDNGVRYTFPAGTIMPDRCAIVIFAGGAPMGTFGGAIVQIAGSLGLNNGGDTITLNDGSTDRATYSYGGEAGNNQSLTRDPDLTGAEPLIWHSTAAGSAGALFSPGTRVDGSAFASCDIPPTVIITTPASSTTNVMINTTINIQFSEVVSASAGAFTLECPIGTPVPVTTTPMLPTRTDNFTLLPTSNLPHSETCAVTIERDKIIDQDGTLDNMAADYNFTFETSLPPAPILISELLYDGLTPSSEGDEFVELCNPNSNSVDLTGYKIGDQETQGGGESMYSLPAISLGSHGCLVIAKDKAQFEARFGSFPNLVETSSLTKYTAWGTGSLSLNNSGDEIVLLGPNDEILDSIAYRNGDYATLGLEPDATAPEPLSLQRVWPTDTNSMPHDFVHTEPNPGELTEPPPLPAIPPPPAALPGGMNAYWGHLHAHTTYSDGAGPPFYALAVARAAGLHFYGISDHAWWLSEAEWDKTFPQVRDATVPGQFVALRGQEWSHDTVGHINLYNTNTLVQRTDPRFDTLPEFYNWLAANPAAIAQFNHPDASYDGNFENFAYNASAAPQLFLQEIGNHAQGYVTYESAFVQSNAVGYRTAPTNNGDTHTAKWGTDTIGRTGIVAPTLTEADLLAALRARRVFSTEDSNLVLALRSNDTWMGSLLPPTGPIQLTVDFIDPDPEPLTLFLYDGNLILAALPFPASTGQWTTTVEARPGHFFWVKVVQADGNTAYSAPIWIEGQLEPDKIYINEILPAPNDNWDWDGNGVADHNDEWIELYNPLDRSVGLGGWRLIDASGTAYDIPLGTTIPAQGYTTLFFAQTNIGLNNSGDSLSLIHPNGTVVDSFSYDHSPGYDESWCRLPDGSADWNDDCGPSPGTANWAKEPPGPLTVSIYDAKRLTRNAWVRVKGRVTAPPGLFGSRTMYIQDETAGIMVYLPQDHRLDDLKLGDKVEVEGNLRSFHQEWEIVVDDRGGVKVKDAGNPPPPLPIATTSLLEPYEGMLVMLQGQAVRFKGRTTFWVDDGTDPAKVYLRGSTGIKKPFIEPGTPMTVVGIVSQYSDQHNPSRDDYRLLPRYQNDLVLPKDQPVPAKWPTMLPDTGH